MPNQFKKNLVNSHQLAKKSFQKNHPHADKWFKQKNLELGQIRAHSQKILTATSLSTALLLSAPASPKLLPLPSAKVRLASIDITPSLKVDSIFQQKLKPFIPKRIGHLDLLQEEQVSKIISQDLGIKSSSTLEGQRLNHSLGWIGYEQHLKRYPGDLLNLHDEEQKSGIAPGLGAWGYFASSKIDFNSQDKMREKYYLAVQTLYLSNWQKDLKFLRDWYKYRKMIVINVENGTSVVAVIGDAGPAHWTGKQFGGSPEVMRSLDLTGKKSKGKVLIYFINDPKDTVPLGPIKNAV